MLSTNYLLSSSVGKKIHIGRATVPSPTDDGDIANKAYVDARLGGHNQTFGVSSTKFVIELGDEPTPATLLFDIISDGIMVYVTINETPGYVTGLPYVDNDHLYDSAPHVPSATTIPFTAIWPPSFNPAEEISFDIPVIYDGSLMTTAFRVMLSNGGLYRVWLDSPDFENNNSLTILRTTICYPFFIEP